MKKKVISMFFIVLVVIVVTYNWGNFKVFYSNFISNSSSEVLQSNEESNEIKKITSLEEYIFLEESKQNQPQLASVFYEVNDIKKIESWLNDNAQIDNLVNMTDDNITVIYVLQLYRNYTQSTRYIYIKKNNGENYIKETSKKHWGKDIYPYTHKDDQYIIDHIGKDGWKKVNPFPIN